MEHRTTVMIARQLGSSGTLIGRRVAELLGARYVDRELLRLTAEHLGCDERDVARLEERPALLLDRLLGVLGLGPPEGPFTSQPRRVTSAKAIYETEIGLLEQLMAKEDCVIIGRAATLKVAPHPKMLNVFVHAPARVRVRRVMEAYGAETKEAAVQMIRDADRFRKQFVAEMTGKEWSCAENYHLAFDSSVFDVDGAARVIVEAVARKCAGRAD